MDQFGTPWMSTPGLNPGPQPWQPAGFGSLFNLILSGIGGTDSSGVPFIQMPRVGFDQRTINERMFAQTSGMFANMLRTSEQESTALAINNIKNIMGIHGQDIPSALASLTAAQIPQLQAKFDPTAGSLSSVLLSSAAGIMSPHFASAGGMYSSASNISSASNALSMLNIGIRSNMWNDNFTKNIAFTRGMTEAELSPIFADMAASGAFGNMAERGRTMMRINDEIRFQNNNIRAARDMLGRLDENDDPAKRTEYENMLKDATDKLKSATSERDRIQSEFNSAVKDAGSAMAKTIDSMKNIFGTAENAAKALRAAYGSEAFGPNASGILSDARTHFSGMLALGQQFGLSGTQIGEMYIGAMGRNASALGYSEDAAALGLGNAMSANLASASILSGLTGVNGARSHGRVDAVKASQIMAGAQERYANASGSSMMKIQAMIQHAAENGIIDKNRAAELRSAILSGDEGVRQNVLKRFFSQAYGSVEAGMEIFNNDVTMQLMYDNISDKGAVADALKDSVNTQDAQRRINAANSRRLNSAKSDMRAAGRSYSDINRTVSLGNLRGIYSALGNMGDQGKDVIALISQYTKSGDHSESDILRFAQSVVRENFEGAEADEILNSGASGGVSAAENAVSKEDILLGRQISDISKMHGSEKYRSRLRDIQKLLGSNPAQARREYGKLMAEMQRTDKAFYNLARRHASKLGSRSEITEKGSEILDQGAAAKGAGVSVVGAAAYGSDYITGQRTDISGYVNDLGRRTAAQEDKSAETARAQDATTKLVDMLTGDTSPAGAIVNPGANQAEWENSKLAEFFRMLKELLEGLMGEWSNSQTVNNSNQAG